MWTEKLYMQARADWAKIILIDFMQYEMIFLPKEFLIGTGEVIYQINQLLNYINYIS